MFGRVQLFVTPWTAACQAPLSMEFPKQIHLSWFPCPPPGDLPDPGIEPMSSASPAWAGRFFATVPLGKPSIIIMCHLMFYQRTVLNISWKNSRLFESVWIVISAFFLKLCSPFINTYYEMGIIVLQVKTEAQRLRNLLKVKDRNRTF